ncbi:MAG: BACON domain-containing protein [Bryobacteraceae bacterium]
MNLAVRLSAILSIVAAGADTVLAQSSTLTISPSTVIFCGKPGQAIAPVPVSISTSTGSVMFIASSVTSDANWLTADPTFATATTFPYPQLVLGINSAFIPFATGNYSGQVVLGTFDGAKLGTIPVLLQVSAAGCSSTIKTGSLFADSGPFTIQLPPGAAASNLINIYNTFPTNVTIIPNATTTTGQNWISLIHSNLTVVTGLLYPAPLNIDISAENLGAGTYTGNIEIDSSNDTSLNVPLTLIVNPLAGNARFVATPSPLSLAIPAGTVSTSAEIKLTNLTSSVVSIGTSVASDRPWLVVSPSSAVIQPKSTVSLTATIIGASLVAGPNKGAINVQVTSGSGSLAIPVTASYGIGGELSAPNPLNITTPPGTTNAVTQVFTVSTNAGLISFSTSAFSSVYQPWLSVTPFNPIVSPGKPASLTVSVQPALLPSGPAIGVITLKPVDGSAPLVIPVNVNAGKDTSLSVVPTQLSFSYQAGGALPPVQSLSLTTTAPTNYTLQATTSTGESWLTVSPPSAMTSGRNAPATLTAQVNPSGLAPNVYKGEIAITNASSGAQQTVPVTLTIGQPLSLSANPAALTFNYQAGAPPMPQAQSVQLASTGGSATFVATASGLNGAPNFLTLNTSSSSTPATLTVGLNASILATLPAGQYSAAVTVSSPGLPAGNQMVSVKLVVSPIAPQPQSVVSSASLRPGPVSPGELVTIYGMNLGPPEGVLSSLTGQGSVPTQVGGATLTFDGFPSPLLYVGAGQINAIVPYEISGRTQTNMIVARNGVASIALPLQVAETNPAIFSGTQNGSGQGAILNADSSYNGPVNPAAKGSVIQIFATGEGAYPGAATGSVTPTTAPFALFPAPVSVTIGGQPAQIQFAGEAPGLIAGILQVNAVVPINTDSGPQQIVLSVGDNRNSPQVITVMIQ